jgi:plasmid maintenance system antidote protein VapI
MAALKTTEQILDELKRRVAGVTQKEAAESLGISTPYLFDLVRGRRAITDKLAAKLGYERVVRWRKVRD